MLPVHGTCCNLRLTRRPRLACLHRAQLQLVTWSVRALAALGASSRALDRFRVTRQKVATGAALPDVVLKLVELHTRALGQLPAC